MSVIFNPDEVLEQIGGEKDLLIEIIKIFVDTYPADLDALQQAILQKDSEEIRKSAHRMKGSVSNFGKFEAFHTAKSMEHKAREGDLSDMPQLYEELVGHLLSLENEVNRYIKDNS